MPRISPCLTAMSMSESTPLRLMPSTARTSFAGPAGAFGVDFGKAAADHHPDERLGIDLGNRPGSGNDAVAQHGDAVADLEDLLQPVRDVDEADALPGEPANDLEQLLELRPAEHGRGFVEYDDAGMAREGAGDLHHLPLGDAQISYPGTRIDRKPQAQQRLPAAADRFAPVDGAEPGFRQTAQKQVLGDAQVRRQHRFLIDDGETAFDHLQGGEPPDGLAVDADLAGIGLIGAGKDLDEGGFPGSVLADQRVHLAWHDLQGNILKGGDAGKPLVDIPHLQNRSRGGAVGDGRRHESVIAEGKFLL